MRREKYGKRFLKYCPFSLYDVECLQMWLEKCAGRGMFLTGSGSVLPGFLMMEYGKPETYRYRIISVLPRTQDDRDMYRMMEDAGWKFVAEGGAGMEIYYTDCPDAPELHTDPGLQAVEVRQVKRYNFALDVPLFLLQIFYWIYIFQNKTGISAPDVICLCFLGLFWIVSLTGRWGAMSIQEKHLSDGRKTDEKCYHVILVRKQIYRFCLLGCLGIVIFFAALHCFEGQNLL